MAPCRTRLYVFFPKPPKKAAFPFVGKKYLKILMTCRSTRLCSWVELLRCCRCYVGAVAARTDVMAPCQLETKCLFFLQPPKKAAFPFVGKIPRVIGEQDDRPKMLDATWIDSPLSQSSHTLSQLCTHQWSPSSVQRFLARQWPGMLFKGIHRRFFLQGTASHTHKIKGQ